VRDPLLNRARLSYPHRERQREATTSFFFSSPGNKEGGRPTAPAGRGGAPAASGSRGAAGGPHTSEGPLGSARGDPRPASHGGRRRRWPVSVLRPEERRTGGERWRWSISRAVHIHRQGGIARDLPWRPIHEPPRQETRVTSGGGGEIGVHALTFAWLDHPRCG
jgi:hypothetical protein